MRFVITLLVSTSMTACGTSSQWSVGLTIEKQTAEAQAAAPSTSETANAIDTVEQQITAQGLALQEDASRQALQALLKRVGIDAMDHPEMIRALGMSDDKLPVDDLLRRRDEILRAIPQTMPADGYLSSQFGDRVAPGKERASLHKGLDIAAMEGTPIYAPADGVVRFAGRYGGFGNYVSIVHGYGIVTKYAHTEKVLVKAGERVKRGELIATVGGSGRSRGVHLHYEVWVNDKAIDPLGFLPPGSVPKHSGESLVAHVAAGGAFDP